MKFTQYLHQSMAATGFCILDSAIASTLRPDLWTNGRECGGDFLYAKKRGFNPPHGSHAYLLRLKAPGGDLDVLARSAHQLAQRIEWITGMEVAELIPLSSLEGEYGPSDVARPASVDAVFRGDQFRGIVTKEAGRTCSDCTNINTVGSCMKADRTGLQRPRVNAERRCLEFTPGWDAMDNRTGRQLWPELSMDAVAT